MYDIKTEEQMKERKTGWDLGLFGWSRPCRAGTGVSMSARQELLTAPWMHLQSPEDLASCGSCVPSGLRAS